MYDQEIVEKKASSPVTTSLLGAACLALVGAMVLQGMRIHSYKLDATTEAQASATVWESKVSKKLDSDVKKALGE